MSPAVREFRQPVKSALMARQRGQAWVARLLTISLVVGFCVGGASLNSTALAAGPRQLDLKILLLVQDPTDPVAGAWQAALTDEGVPFDMVTGSGSNVTLPTLSDGDVGHYNGVVIAGSPGSYAAGALDALFAYEAAFGVRQVNGYMFPSPALGVTASSGGSLDGVAAKFTTAGLALLPGMKGPFPFDSGSYGYSATVNSGAPYTSIIEGPNGTTMAGVYQHPSSDAQSGVSELSLHFSYNSKQLHWLLLAPELIDWVTQNTHLGLHRNYFGQDIDDLFLADDSWSSQYQCTPGATDPIDFNCPAGATIPPDTLMTPADVDHVVAWQKQTGIRLNLAFNGVGACTGPTLSTSAVCSGSVTHGATTYTLPGFNVDSTAPDTSALTASLLANKSEFNWIIHTWSHAFLGCNVWGPQPLTTVTANAGGGTLPAGETSYLITAATAYGESEPSPVKTVTVAGGGSATLVWPEAPNGTGDTNNPGPTLSEERARYSGGTGFWGYKVYRKGPGSTTFGLVGQVVEAANATASTVYQFTDTGAAAGPAPETDSNFPTATNPGIGCTTNGWLSAATIKQEIALDQAFAAANGLTSLPAQQYTQNAVVTGEHSGVENPNMPAAFNAVGVTNFAQDASRQPAQYSLGNAVGAPRYPSNIYYNASNWTDQLNEYNTLYVAAGTPFAGGTGRCVNTSTTTCRSTAATKADFLASESKIMLGHVLANDPRIGYAHQPNLIGSSTPGEGYTLLDLISNMLDQYNAVHTDPLTQLTVVSSAQVLSRQTAWHTAISGGQVKASVKDGVVTISNSGSAVDIPVTVPNGTTVNGSVFGDSYSGVRSAWTTVGSTPLILNQNVAPSIISAASASSIVGAPFSTTVVSTGAPTARLTESGLLPAGITFTDNGNGTATISGTAGSGTGGNYPITITATNSSGTVTQAFTLANSEAPSITSASTATFSTGVQGSYTVTTTGFPAATITSSGSLPAGLTFTAGSDGTATIAGIAAAGTAGTYPVTISATNASGSTAALALTITVISAAAPTITSGAAAYFTLNQAGAVAIMTTGSPVAKISESGTLPDGLTFTDNFNGSALIQGTPTATGTSTMAITAANGITPDATQTFTIVVGQAPSFTSSSSASFTAGTAGSYKVTTSGYPAPGIGATGLPNGLSLTDNNDGTATISGTAAASDAGAHQVTLTAVNGTGSASQTLELTITVKPAFTSGSAVTLPAGAPGAFTVTTTGSPIAAITQSGLPGSLSLTDNGDGTAAISGTPTTADSGTRTVTLTATNSSGSATQALTLTITATAGPAITSAAGASFTAGQPGSFTVTTTGSPTAAITETGALPSGMKFTDNGDGTGTIAGTPAAGTQGSYALTLTAANSAGPSAVQNFSLVVNSGLAITSVASATAVSGQPFSFVVQATGSPIPTLTRTGTLPAGVSFVANANGTATLSGTPTAAANGIYQLTFTARNSTGTSSQAFVLTVSQRPTITSAATVTETAGTAFSFPVTSTGYPSPTISTSAALPAGLSLTPGASGTAALSGASSLAAGVYSVSFVATNVGGSATQAFTLTVKAPAAGTVPAFTSAAAATATVGKAFIFSVTTTAGANTNVTRTGTLPAGIGFTNLANGKATLSGIPTGAKGGTYPLTFTARNTAGTTTQSFILTVNAGPGITSATSATATVGSTFNFTVVSTGSPTSAITQSGALPDGLTFSDNQNGTGTLSGIPSGSGGSYPLTFTATNSQGKATQSFVLTVNKAPSITSDASANVKLRQAFAITITAAGWPAPSIGTTGTLPKGVTYTNNGNGRATLAGTPTVAGTYTLILTARNSLGTATQTYTLTVS